MATPEGKTKDMIKKLLKPFVDQGVLFYFMPVQGKFANSGIPDFLLCFKGKFIGIEAKAEGKLHNTTLKQEDTIRKINDAQGFACVISCKEEMEEFIKLYMEN